MKPPITILVLACVLLQALFGGLHSSVVICLGGGHDHQVQEVVETCCSGCSHENQWPTPGNDEGHGDDCGCTDIELTLITLVSVRRCVDQLPALPPPAPDALTPVATQFKSVIWSSPPPSTCGPGDGFEQHATSDLAIVRLTRRLV